MSTPTIIRMAQYGDEHGVVVTYFEHGRLNASFQVYRVKFNRTALIIDAPGLGEKWATGQFADWAIRKLNEELDDLKTQRAAGAQG